MSTQPRLTLLVAVALWVCAGPALGQEPEPAPATEPAPGETAPTEPLDEPAPEAAPEANPTPAPEPPPEAAPEPAPSDEEQGKQAALVYVQEGKRLFGQELYAGALEAFKKAYELHAEPAYLYNIAICYERVGDSQNCVDWFEAYVDGFKKLHAKDPADIADVRNAIAKCRLGARVDVYVDTEPKGAAVAIDAKDKLLGQTPYSTQLDPGTYKFFVDLDKHQPLEHEVEVRAGEPVRLFFKLEKVQRNGTVRVTANIRNAQIFIDGRNIGLTPYREDIVLDEGMHQITVSKDEYASWSQEIEVAANEAYEVRAEVYLRDPPTTWKGPLGWTSIAVGALLGGGGVAAGFQADLFFSDSDDFAFWSTLQKVGYGVGGGLLAVGIGLVIWEAVDDEMVKDSDRLEDAVGEQLSEERGLRWSPVVTFGPNGGYAGALLTF